MKLVLAQGAEHTNPNRLCEVVSIINKQNGNSCNIQKSLDVCNQINEKYGINITPFDVAVYLNDYVVEEKFDGYSYLNTEGKFFSKRLSAAKGNEGQPIEKTGHLPHLSPIMQRAYERGGLDLHGEIYIPNGISDDITKILGCNEDEAVRRINADWGRRPKFMLIDIRAFHGIPTINEPYYVRRILLEYAFYKYIENADRQHDISVAPILLGDPVVQFKRIVNSGGEGIIIKKTSALYVPGKKPADNWIKGKKKITLDVIITGYNDGTGKNKSLFGSIEFGLYEGGKVVKCGNTSSGLNDDTRKLIAQDPDGYIGHVVEIEAIQESAKSFRNAVFIRLRADKDMTECTRASIRVVDRLI